MKPEFIKQLLFKLRKAKQSDDKIIACCPYHNERNPSFAVLLDKLAFNCFGCGESGNLKRLAWKLGIDESLVPLSSSIKRVEEHAEVVYRVNTTVKYASAYFYYRGRGISKKLCDKFGFKYDPSSHSAILPVTFLGVYRGFLERNVTGSTRYMARDGLDVSQVIWGFDYCDKSLPVYICEGIIDAASFWEQGKQAVALLGKSWKHKLKYLKELEEPIVVPDNGDLNSSQTFTKLKRELGGHLYLTPSKYKDVNEAHLDNHIL